MGGAAYPERGADGALTDSIIGISGAHHKSRGRAGIAEAPLATALGLVAANPRGHDLQRARALDGQLPRADWGCVRAGQNLASRDLDRGKLPRPPPNEGRGLVNGRRLDRRSD
jgi:hypothetical protein